MKFKKIISIILVSVLSIGVFTSCSSFEENNLGGDSEFKIAMVANAPIADGGWNTACYEAMVEAAKEEGFDHTYTDNVQQTDYVTTFRAYANLGYDLIFAPGNEFTDAIFEVAEYYPDTKFAILNGEDYGDNVQSLLPDNEQIGFIAGALAALKSQTNSVGFVGGLDITPTRTMMNFYEKGAKYINPNIKVSTAMANSFDDTAKGKEIALSMMATNDVDVFFGHASAVDSGVREGIATKENRWSIAQPTELLDENPDIILTSIITSNTQLLRLAMTSVKDNTYGNKIVKGTLGDNVLTIGQYGKSCSEELQKEFIKIVDKVKNEEIDLSEL